MGTQRSPACDPCRQSAGAACRSRGKVLELVRVAAVPGIQCAANARGSNSGALWRPRCGCFSTNRDWSGRRRPYTTSPTTFGDNAACGSSVTEPLTIDQRHPGQKPPAPQMPRSSFSHGVSIRPRSDRVCRRAANLQEAATGHLKCFQIPPRSLQSPQREMESSVGQAQRQWE